MMKNWKMSVLCALAITAATSAFAEDKVSKDPTVEGDRAAINQACAADAQTAGCSGMTAGHGLMKCLHAYKKAHKDFKISDSCKAARQKRVSDRKAFRAQKGK